MSDLENNYRWYRQRDPREYGSRLEAYPARLALAMARADVVKGKKHYPTSPSGNWQALDEMPRYASHDSRAYYIDAWPAGWRDRGDASKIAGLRHTGWYEDSFQESLCLGRVLQLPTRKGKPVYIPGTHSTGDHVVTLYPLDRYDDETDCARAADGYAERAAERAREYNDSWQAGNRAADLWSEADKLRSDILVLVSDLRTARRVIRGYRGAIGSAAVRLCEAGRERVAAMLTELYQLREKRDALTEDNDAFREGLGR